MRSKVHHSGAGVEVGAGMPAHEKNVMLRLSGKPALSCNVADTNCADILRSLERLLAQSLVLYEGTRFSESARSQGGVEERCSVPARNDLWGHAGQT